MNTFPARFLFLRTPEAKERLLPALAPGNVEKTRAAPVCVIVGYDRRFYERLATLFPHKQDARAMFEGMPGLRFKFFTFDEEERRATNFYVWESKEAAVSFFSDELRERVTDLYGVAPTIEFVEIAQIVDNSGS